MSTNAPNAALKTPGADSQLTSLFAGIVRYLRRRAALAKLREFDDDALRDIGIAHSEIEAVVSGSARSGATGQ